MSVHRSTSKPSMHSVAAATDNHQDQTQSPPRHDDDDDSSEVAFGEEGYVERPPIEGVHKWDVLLGRGRQVHHHPGNREYRKHLKTRSGLYVVSPPKTKDAICAEIVQAVYDRGGNFLRPQRGDLGHWEECPKQIVTTKVKQALRDFEKERVRLKRMIPKHIVNIPRSEPQPEPEPVPSAPDTVVYSIEVDDSEETETTERIPKTNCTSRDRQQQLLKAASLLARAAALQQPQFPVAAQMTTTTQSVFNMPAAPTAWMQPMSPYPYFPPQNQTLMSHQLPQHVTVPAGVHPAAWANQWMQQRQQGRPQASFGGQRPPPPPTQMTTQDWAELLHRLRNGGSL